MIKYFLVNNASRAAAYGIGTYIKQIAFCLRNSLPQYELSFLDIHSDVGDFSISKDEEDNLHYRIPSVRGDDNAIAYYRSILFLLSPYVGEEEVVVFHFNYSLHFDLMRLVKAKYMFCRIVYTIHYFDWCFSLDGNLTRFRKLICDDDIEDVMKENIRSNYQHDKRLLSICDDVIVLSKFTYNLLRNEYKMDGSKLHLVYNGMYKDEKIIQHSNVKGIQKEILFVGRLDKIKGIEYIIKASKMIIAHDKTIHLTLVGDGDFSRYLALCEGIWDNITFTGKLSKDNLEQFYHRATIGVQPSFHEQCSYSAIEMMAHGIPFIATDSTGLGEMMDYTPECLVHIDEENFQPDEFVKQLADKMTALIYNDQLREHSSLKLLQLFQKRYCVDHMKNSIKKIFAAPTTKVGELSKDFMPYLDSEVIRLIARRPVLDMDYVGLTGIGCYLWWRIETLKGVKDKTELYTSMKLQENLIYYIDWLYDVIEEDGKNAFSSLFELSPLKWLLKGLKNAGFYKTRVEKTIKHIHALGVNLGIDRNKYINKAELMQTALKIYNLNL